MIMSSCYLRLLPDTHEHYLDMIFVYFTTNVFSITVLFLPLQQIRTKSAPNKNLSEGA